MEVLLTEGLVPRNAAAEHRDNPPLGRRDRAGQG
jgi:hypothetical protein